MKKWLIAILLLLLPASLCFGQVPTSAMHGPGSDLYFGYIGTYPDYGEFGSFRLNGGEVAYTRDFTTRWTAIASGTAVFGSSFNVNEYSATAGAKYNFRTGVVRPYATVQAGFSYQHSNGMYSYDHHPPLKPNTTDVEDGFSYRGGIGVDIILSRKLYWRLFQWDIQPQPWGLNTPFYFNLTSGIGFRL